MILKNKEIYIGPAGWSYKDWEGVVYPNQKARDFDRLRYLAGYFDVIEINSSFYRPSSPKMCQSWVKRVAENPDFMFTYKLWQEYTHERDRLPSASDEKMIKSGLDILQTDDRLGAVLVQFPWSFKYSEENLVWLEKVTAKFSVYNPVVEMRHQSWLNNDFFSFLEEKDIAFANIDQPVIGKSVPLTTHIFGKVNYLRLHGRNRKNWFANDATVASRYDYLYSEKELKQIKQKIEDMMEHNAKTYIIFNNHYRGQAPANALQTMFLLKDSKVSSPEELIQNYPKLKDISLTQSNETGQARLF